MKKFFAPALCALLAATAAYSQVRPVDTEEVRTDVKPAPQSVAAKYEGGMFGYREKKEGTLRFDDANKRLVFFDKESREMISLPYSSLLVISPNSTSSTSTTGTVISNAPLPGAGLARLMKEKKRYLVIQFDDPDSQVRGIANFKIDGKDLLESVIHTLGSKAKLTQRGDSFYRPRAGRGVI